MNQTPSATAVEPRPPALRPERLKALLISAPLIFVVYNIILLERLFSRGGWWLFEFIRYNYTFNTLAFPFYVAFCGAIGLYCARRGGSGLPRRLRAYSFALLGMAAALWGARGWATYLEPSLLFVREVRIATPKLERPVRILHISDTQCGGVGRIERCAFARMRELAPDMIIFTGDLLQPVPPLTYESELPKIEELLRTLDPPLGFFAAVGDTDPPILHQLRAGLGGMRLLEGQSATVEAQGVRLNLYGLPLGPSRGAEPARPEVERWHAQADPAEFTILFAHGPDYILESRDLPIDLCLAGHTHGGQIRIPFFGPPITYSNIPRDWARGYREVGATRLNVSAGLGNEHLAGIPNLRVNCPPEMTLIELVPVEGHSSP